MGQLIASVEILIVQLFVEINVSLIILFPSNVFDLIAAIA